MSLNQATKPNQRKPRYFKEISLIMNDSFFLGEKLVLNSRLLHRYIPIPSIYKEWRFKQGSIISQVIVQNRLIKDVGSAEISWRITKDKKKKSLR